MDDLASMFDTVGTCGLVSAGLALAGTLLDEGGACLGDCGDGGGGGGGGGHDGWVRKRSGGLDVMGRGEGGQFFWEERRLNDFGLFQLLSSNMKQDDDIY